LLPFRWNTKKRTIMKKYSDNKEALKENLEDQERIQRNLTDKLIRNFRRLEFHLPGLLITSYPMELDSKLHICLKGTYTNNEFLNSLREDVSYFRKSVK